LVYSGSKPEHGHHASHNKGYVEHCIDISHQRELNIDELKVLEKQNDRIEEISTQEGRRIDHNSIYVLSTDIHNAKSQQEP
jgi:cell division FtsZ-interacting protein ZapD